MSLTNNYNNRNNNDSKDGATRDTSNRASAIGNDDEGYNSLNPASSIQAQAPEANALSSIPPSTSSVDVAANNVDQGTSNAIVGEEEKAGLIKSVNQGNITDANGFVEDGVGDSGGVGEEWITVEQAMERLGAGRFQARILIASGLCFAADAMQVILLSFLTLVLKEEWALSPMKTQYITPCLFAGSMLGTLILGPAADKYGRRPIFLMSATIISIFGFGTALSNNYWLFLFLLFCVGFGLGGLVVPFDLLAEFLPSSGRGKILLSIEYFWTVGCLYVVGVAYVTLHGMPQGGGEDGSSSTGGGHHWRTFVVLCTWPCLVSLIIGYFCVPESALWLASEGRSEEALEVLRKGAISNGHEDPFSVFPQNLHLRRDASHRNASIADLFTPEWREITFRLWGTWCGFAFGYYGAILAVTKVFEKTDDDDGDSTSPNTDVHYLEAPSSTEKSYDFDYSAIFLSSAAELVGTTLVIILVDRVGRISSQVGCYFLAGICVCLLCVLHAWEYPRYVLVIFGFAARVFEMGGTCTTWVSTAEILTTEVRSTGHSTANAMARMGAFLCPFLVEGNMSLVEIGVVMFFVHLFTAFCASKLPETKGKEMGGRPSSGHVDHEIEEIEGVDFSEQAALDEGSNLE
ncbi:hypothetical protein ACA910_012676 [Epithemia clementina (nom. ined.)]